MATRHNQERGFMREFVGEGGAIAFRISETLARRHLHEIRAGGIERPVTAMLDGGASRRKESFGMLNPRHGFRGFFCLGGVMRG